MTTFLGPSGECQTASGKAAGDPLEVGENPVAPLVAQPLHGGGEEAVVAHLSGITRCQRLLVHVPLDFRFGSPQSAAAENPCLPAASTLVRLIRRTAP